MVLKLEIFPYGNMRSKYVMENYYKSNQGLHYHRGGTCYIASGCIEGVYLRNLAHITIFVCTLRFAHFGPKSLGGDGHRSYALFCPSKVNYHMPCEASCCATLSLWLPQRPSYGGGVS